MDITAPLWGYWNKIAVGVEKPLLKKILKTFVAGYFSAPVDSHKKVLEWNRAYPLEYGRGMIQDWWEERKKARAERELSEEQLDRVFKILDLLCRSLIVLGCKILPNLLFEVCGVSKDWNIWNAGKTTS